jgi:hypothetical protein
MSSGLGGGGAVPEGELVGSFIACVFLYIGRMCKTNLFTPQSRTTLIITLSYEVN